MVSSGKEKSFPKLFIENLMKSKIKLDWSENYPIKPPVGTPNLLRFFYMILEILQMFSIDNIGENENI